jgi:hypothetical protein
MMVNKLSDLIMNTVLNTTKVDVAGLRSAVVGRLNTGVCGSTDPAERITLQLHEEEPHLLVLRISSTCSHVD